MSETFEPPPVAQRSRRDKLRVQQQQLGSDQYQNPSDLMFNSTNDVLPFSGCLDFGHGLSSSDWMMNPNPSSSSSTSTSTVIYPLLPSHLYNLPAEIPAQETQYQNALQEIVTSSHGRQLNAVASETQGLSLSLSSKPLRAVGPLGPFTGYAVILKSSKFLKPAQELLGELCGTGCYGAKQFHKHDGYADERPNLASNYGGYDGSNSVRGQNSEPLTSSLFYSSTEGGKRSEGWAGSCQVVQGPEVQQKRMKLLYMQEEVCRRHKQYHQQMQMMVSSFESVAGLSSAAPYTSTALKCILKKFRSLKHVISKQLRHLGRILQEEFTSSPTNSSSKGESMTTIGLKYVDQSLRKQKATENRSLCLLDNNQPVWRPQRGLPERAVSVLRAWLFQHFLHPYPTDTDKHMLATQTGLSRNQVSNWFINARVRLWKPMVEEMHTLESNGSADMDLNSSSNKNEGKAIIMDDGGRQPCSEAQSMDLMVASESSLMSIERWHREKRSRMEELTGAGNMDVGMMSFPYHGAMNIGGMGPVSLTLGLRHYDDSQQQQHQLRHLGGHMLHGFVG